MAQTPSPSFPDTAWALDLLWVGLLAIYAFAGYPVTPFHGDESMQIYMSRDYAYTVQDRDLNKLLYDPQLAAAQDLEQGLRILNGTVNKYAIGLAWDLAGYTREDLNAAWYWDESYAFNVENGFYPGDGLLLAARVPSALFLSGAVMAIFFAGRAFAGRPTAYAAALYLALSPAVLLNGRRAMMEGSMLFGTILTLLFGLWLVRRGRGAWAAAALLGMSAGFAVGSKHTSVVAVVAVFAGCTLYGLAGRQGFRLIPQLMLAGGLALATFFALNPAYWGNPAQTAAAVMEERTALLGGQVSVFDGYTHTGQRVLGFYRAVFDGQPMYFEVDSFQGPLAAQIATYEATPYAGVYLPGVGPALLGAFALGMAVVVGLIRLPGIQPGGRWVLGSYAIITTLFALFAIPLGWQRYYLPMFPVVALVAPLGIQWVVRLYLQDAFANARQYRKGSARVRPS